ncbi:MAG: DUF1501 domain-containing protein [Limisphaerales bacterium]
MNIPSLQRRDFLYGLGSSLGALAMTDLLAKEAGGPLAPKKPMHAPKAKNVIMLFMEGGPGHMDTFDPKPKLNALHKTESKSTRGLETGFKFYVGSPFKSRKVGQAGLEMSDQWQHLPEVADELCNYRGCTAESLNHPEALFHMNTGSRLGADPALGAWVNYGLGTTNQNLPGYVVMLDKRGGPISGQPNWSSGFMPSTFQGTLFRPSGNPILDLEGPAHLDARAQRRQLDLLAKLNQKHLDERPGGRELAARIQSYELAYRMQAEAPEAVDLSREKQATRDMYGIGQQPTDEYGRNCLIARRLVERGVRFIQLYSGGGHLEDTWDGHESIEKNHGLHGAEVDQPIAALLTDLEQRGLLDSTLVVWGGEFGRMPFSEGKGAPGRNHNPYGFCMWMAGGGVKGGMSYGETDEFGFEAVVNKTHVHDIHATILHLMGIDHEALSYFHQGRKETLTDVHGRIIREICA